jgi:predicted glycogen debranching enzyme
MDAKCGETVFTPRHGKPVEVNALWHHALLCLARRAGRHDPPRASRYREMAENARLMFVRRFWNHTTGCLNDVVRDGSHDAAVRPNQVLAVSLPDSPLDRGQQRAVIEVVERDLLTPFGLRSLSPRDPSYRGRYEGGLFERDGAYHQGTVWGWLMGPYVEACLRVHGFSPEARETMRARLRPLIEHLDEAGINSVSEIFDGDPPHTPRGCIAQAWSVGELLRAWRLTAPD